MDVCVVAVVVVVVVVVFVVLADAEFEARTGLSAGGVFLFLSDLDGADSGAVVVAARVFVCCVLEE